MNKNYFTPREELHNELLAVLEEHQKKIEAKKLDRLRSINYVAKKLGLAHSTVKRFVANGIIKSTKSGLIKDSEIKKYLGDD